MCSPDAMSCAWYVAGVGSTGPGVFPEVARLFLVLRPLRPFSQGWFKGRHCALVSSDHVLPCSHQARASELTFVKAGLWQNWGLWRVMPWLPPGQEQIQGPVRCARGPFDNWSKGVTDHLPRHTHGDFRSTCGFVWPVPFCSSRKEGTGHVPS